MKITVQVQSCIDRLSSYSRTLLIRNPTLTELHSNFLQIPLNFVFFPQETLISKLRLTEPWIDRPILHSFEPWIDRYSTLLNQISRPAGEKTLINQIFWFSESENVKKQ